MATGGDVVCPVANPHPRIEPRPPDARMRSFLEQNLPAPRQAG